MAKPVFVGIGEVLWDVLPTGKQMGGAPSNFAYIATLLGNRGVIVSSVGDDDLGREARQACAALGLDVSYLQTDPEHPTSTVDVELTHGQPAFNIHTDIAWDHLRWSPELDHLAHEADVVIFGSLAQRSRESRETAQKFIRATREHCLRIFDVNLRQSFYSPEVLKTGFALASATKLNDEELPIVLNTVGLGETGDVLNDLRQLLDHFGLEIACLTRGAHGSLLVTKERCSEHPGFRIKLADAVGAGDAFTAGMAHALRMGATLDVVNEFANRIGSWIASERGATPKPSTEQLALIQHWSEPLHHKSSSAPAD